MNDDIKSKSILVVDDTPENISIIGQYLSSYQVKVATNGQKALQIAEGTELDLILLDIKMPDMDGYEVCHKLKENPKTKDVPVIFLTVMSDTTDKVHGFELGAVDYITKPFQIDEVKSRIEAHLASNAYKKMLKNMNDELEKLVEERTSELLFAKAKAEEASRLKSYFLAIISHELRTPLTGILGFTEILMDEAEEKNLKDYAAAANQSALHLKETFNSIIYLSDNYAKRQTINLFPINLNKRIENLLRHSKISAEQKSIDLVFHGEEEINTALDWIMFDIIFNNLVGNAIKFTDKGKIEIRLSKERKSNNHYDCITVSDTGIGIPIEKQSTIFEEFRQADEGMSRSSRGIGLGLSLVEKFVGLHDGIIELNSKPGAGSSFKIMFPHVCNIAARDNECADNDIIIPKAKFEKVPKILSVENNLDSIEDVRLYIKNIAEVNIADNGFTAIDLAKKNKYNAILINLKLAASISGIETVKEIKKIYGYNEIPIIGYVLNTVEEEPKSFFNKEELQYLSRPVNRKELINLLAELL
jgi:two-component system, sensor histidine kinase and response regulator